MFCFCITFFSIIPDRIFLKAFLIWLKQKIKSHISHSAMNARFSLNFSDTLTTPNCVMDSICVMLKHLVCHNSRNYIIICSNLHSFATIVSVRENKAIYISDFSSTIIFTRLFTCSKDPIFIDRLCSLFWFRRNQWHFSRICSICGHDHLFF